MVQARDSEVTQVLEELQDALPGASVAVLTRAGSLFAGRTPPEVDRETFSAMMAVMHGAGESGTAELGEELVWAEARLKAGAVIVLSAGRKMILCAYLKDSTALEGARARLAQAASRLAPLF
jgi:predicted regulator of Ras-like GTPase activity (Roadblock/LC7/MglB family)